MKYLSEYLDDKVSAIMSEFGCFFAFSSKQFAEKKVEGVKYSSFSSGMICPTEYCSEVDSRIREAISTAIKEDIADNGEEAVIRRELINHEATYTGSINSTLDALAGYGVSKEQVAKQLKKLIEEE